uniref:Saposin B-type domain-containing protein n=1 Tax=Panagrellus redivivus TaxID=6233 RepID=A0A7E4W856_PANRE
MQSRTLILVAGIAFLFLVAPSTADECQTCKDVLTELHKHVNLSLTEKQRNAALEKSCKAVLKEEEVKKCIDDETPNLRYIESAFFKKREIDVICKELKRC